MEIITKSNPNLNPIVNFNADEPRNNMLQVERDIFTDDEGFTFIDYPFHEMTDEEQAQTFGFF